METRNLKISKETANRWYNGSDEELKQLALQTFPELEEKELPKSWEELGEDFLVLDQRFGALARLEILRDIYNDGWVADWTKNSQDKFCIEFCIDDINKVTNIGTNKFLSFKDAKTRDLFLENFRDLILTAKPLLG
jgi:hypothetical protein